MRVFVGYGYNDRDAWIEKLVFPLLKALGCEPVEAKVSFGSDLTTKVKQTLLGCNAMVGFLTRRDSAGTDVLGNPKWTTHTWVVQELGAAYAEMPVIEVREKGIDPQLGMGASYQRIEFEETNRDQCLVELAVAIAELREENSVHRFRLGPPNVAEQIRSGLPPGSGAQYRVRTKNKESAPRQSPIVRIQGALYVDIPNLKPDDFVEISVDVGGKLWRSDYEAVDAVEVKLG